MNHVCVFVCAHNVSLSLCQGENYRGSNSGSLASLGSHENDSVYSGKDSDDKQSFLESSLNSSAGQGMISFARAAVSPGLFITCLPFSPVLLTVNLYMSWVWSFFAVKFAYM